LDEAANELSYEEYQPYGDPSVSVLVDDHKIYRFVQKELDSITGLYAIGQRYYIPSQGRWISPDPAGDIDGSNLFAYVRGNPITRRDENGECGHPPGQENQPPTNLQKVYTSMKLLNVWNTALNGILDARVTHLEMTHQFKYPFSGKTAEIYKAGFQGAMLGRVGIFAMFGGITGLASSTANMAKYGPNRSNVLNSVGNIFFAAEGYTMLSALIQSSHGFHHKMILASKLGGVADMTKAVNSALDRDYYSTAMYTSLGMGNLFVTMSTKTRLSYYRQAVKATPKDFRLLTRLAMRGFVSPQYLLLLGGGMSLYKAVKLTGSQQGGSSSHGHHD
jgi:RHS repeat-associated protein